MTKTIQHSKRKIQNCLFVFFVFFVGTAPGLGSEPEAHKRIIRLMGSRFEITAVSADDSLALQSIEAAVAEITRIERLISSWDPNSQTSDINRNAGMQPVIVDPELFELIRRSKKVSELTDGAFDISFASIDKIWTFDKKEHPLPDSEFVAESVKKIDYHHILLDSKTYTVLLKEAGMKIGFGAIGKGYAANRAKAVMQAMGIANGLVNAGGDLIAWGQQPDGQSWQVGIADPSNEGKMLGWLAVDNTAVVTSGDYERYFTSGGKRYAHIIDPKTGYPVTGLKSVTIVSPDAELADALATAVFVLGRERGTQLIDALQGVECLVVNDRNELTTSKNLALNAYSVSRDKH